MAIVFETGRLLIGAQISSQKFFLEGSKQEKVTGSQAREYGGRGSRVTFQLAKCAPGCCLAAKHTSSDATSAFLLQCWMHFGRAASSHGNVRSNGNTFFYKPRKNDALRVP